MAAPKGNKFWERRSKHGRDKLFKTPTLLWQAACEYFQWCQDNPWIKHEVVKSGNEAGMLLPIPTARPFTLTALAVYLDASTGYWREFRSTASEDFLAVIRRIEDVMYAQKFEGAAVGAFNANIIARDLGLKEGVDHTSGGDKITAPPPINVYSSAPPLASSEDVIDEKDKA